MSSVEKNKINDMIDGAITKAESMGVKVISLGLLNQVTSIQPYVFSLLI